MSSVDENKLEEFLCFIKERQDIAIRKAMGEDPPWTEDPVLQEHHFCNVYRELDRGTKYVIENILEPDIEYDTWLERDRSIFLNVVVYRMTNLPETHKAIGGFTKLEDFDPEGCVEILRNRDENVFSTAYRICGSNWTEYNDKIGQIFLGIIRDHFLKDFDRYSRLVLAANTMQEAHEGMKELYGVGDFLAYEIITDLNYRVLPFDENDFVNVGPGAKRGLEIVYNDIDDYESKILSIVNKQSLLFERYNINFHYWNGMEAKRLTLRDIEHSLCEFDKYMRAKEERGNIRKYTPHQ